MTEARCTLYSVHLGGDKLYKYLKKTFWWPGMKKDVAEFVARCLTCQRVKGEQRRPQDLLKQNGVQPDRQELCREVEKRFTPYTTKKWRGGEIKSKLVVCNREGFAHKTPSKDRDDGLVGEKSQRIFRLKIGETKTYRICKEQVNGFENIGVSLNDFKNFHRDVKCFIHERDGQLFVDHFKEMTETRIGFYFDYDLDDDGSLRRAIWADGTARDNYKIFGDAVSFDPTYSTNKYSMLFTPFTGVDHHKRFMTFYGALIARDEYESFNWVFSRFLQAIGGKEPEYIITDQDPGIIKSVPLVFKTARHRFCMWHIMNKMPSKFGVSRSDYNDFMCKINDIIWDDELEAAEFDGIWEQIIVDHGVGVNDLFADTTGGFTKRGELEVTTVKDSSRKKNFEVAYSPALTDDKGTRKASRSCTMFERTGILCRHIIWIFSASGIKTKPEDYVVNRWMKEYLRLRIFNTNGEGTENMQIIDEKQIAMSIMWSEVHEDVGLLRDKGVADVDSFSAVIRAFKQSLSPLGEVLNKNQQMEKFLNCTPCEVVTILPPKNSKNKGTGKRLLSAKTKAMVLARKPKRKCKNCKRMTNHDKRNCPNPFSAHTPLCEGSSEPEENEGEEEEELESEQE
ncbi:protein FAR1-RELATED SEQUENCE 7-like [Silene latifolia]|uniref:protein FAR1-RELATED SEQUENCE 7-like n=1 Tax=Silene latifolia TaxID=37657 RepID=UPI003D76E386